MTEYPRLVRRLPKTQSLRIICQGCEAEADLDPDDLNQDGEYPCPAECSDHVAVFKYIEADLCANCDTLGFYKLTSEGGRTVCSRRCKFQRDYLEQLPAAVIVHIKLECRNGHQWARYATRPANINSICPFCGVLVRNPRNGHESHATTGRVTVTNGDGARSVPANGHNPA